MAEKNETEVACTICLELFTEPKVLPCCHTFCKGCLEGILEKSKNKERVACPQCRTEHQVPPNGPEGFLNDYTLKTKENESKSNPSVDTCELCDEQGTAVSYCSVCSAFLCESCTGAHKTIKFLKSHKIESLQSGKRYIPVKKDKILPCSQHPDKSLELYCRTCQCLVCTLCIVASHNGHKLSNTDSETRKDAERQIEDLVAEVESKLAEYETNSEYISEVEKETVEESVQIKGEINSLFDSIVTALETRRAGLLETVEVSFNKDLKELWAQKEHVETTVTGLKGTLTFAKRSLQCTHDLELLMLGSQVMARLKELNKLQWESESTETIEKTARRFDHVEPISLSTLGELKTTMIPNCLDISLEMSSSAQLGEPVEFNVALGIRSKTKLTRKQNQQLSVEILYGMARVKIPHPPTVIPYPNGRTWSVTFNPVVSGAHVVQVKGAKIQSGTDCEEMKIETVINITARKPEPLLEVLLSVKDSPVQQNLPPANSYQDLPPAKSSHSQQYLPPAESYQDLPPAKSSHSQQYLPPANYYQDLPPAKSSHSQQYLPPAKSYQDLPPAKSSHSQQYLPPAKSYQDLPPAKSSHSQQYLPPAESYQDLPPAKSSHSQQYLPPAESYQDLPPAKSSHSQQYLPPAESYQDLPPAKSSHSQQYLPPAKSYQDLPPAKSSHSQQYLPPAKSYQDLPPAKSSHSQQYLPPAESSQDLPPAKSSHSQQYLPPAKSYQDLPPAKSSHSQQYLPPAESYQDLPPAKSSHSQQYLPPAKSYQDLPPAKSSHSQQYLPPAKSYQDLPPAKSSHSQQYLPPAESYRLKQDNSPAKSSRPQQYSLPAESSRIQGKYGQKNKKM